MPSRTRLSPEQRRSQLLDLGVRLFAQRSLHEISIDLLAETAGISRGLLYHYFGNLAGFQVALVERAAEDLIARTAPPPGEDPVERLVASLTAYVDYVDTHYEGYLSLVRGARSGDERLQAIYDRAFAALGERFIAEAPDLVPGTAAGRLLVRGWQAMAEEMVLAWKAGLADASQIPRDELIRLLAASFPAVLTALS